MMNTTTSKARVSPDTPMLPPPFAAARHGFDLQGVGRLCVYAQRDTLIRRDPPVPPLLVVHSVNATASAIEMAPVYERQSRRRPVVALELPGFGSSARPPVHYTPAMMSSAIRGALDWTSRHVAPGPADVMALSLAAEFAAEAALAQPGEVRSLVLVSPTGMEGRRSGEVYEQGRTREMPWLRRVLHNEAVGRMAYRLLTSRASMRWFLARAWGGPDFDPRLLDYGHHCAEQPGARHAPLDFIAGALFTRGIIERYRLLTMPVWVAHGRRGSFTDFNACPEPGGRTVTGVPRRITRTAFDSGSMPHYQRADEFDAAYERFLSTVPAPAMANAPVRAAAW